MASNDGGLFPQHAVIETTLRLSKAVLDGRIVACDEVIDYIRSTEQDQILQTMTSALSPNFGHYLDSAGDMSALE